MNARTGTAGLKRVPRPWAALLHLALLAGVLALFFGRKPGWLRSEAILACVPDFYLHVSNFAISYLLYAGIGNLWLMMGLHGVTWHWLALCWRMQRCLRSVRAGAQHA